MTRAKPSQPLLFELGDAPLEAAEPRFEHVELAAKLPSSIRLGTMSWSYPGWRGVVYAANADAKQLADRGLSAYSRQPLLTTVEIDRTYYEPLAPSAFRRFAEQVPDSFRFVIKAHEDCVVRRFPSHARYGKKRDTQNSLYLDAAHATETVIAPACQGLAEKLGVVLFQFPPQDVGSVTTFTNQLRAFLLGLPPGPAYAVELRNRELFTPAYVAALAEAGAVHCHNVWGEMPSVLIQARAVPPPARRPLVIRWLMRRGDDYKSAGERYKPFGRLVDEDVTNRREVALLLARASEHGVSTYALLDNKAEGCAPETAVRLARAIVERGLRSE